MPVKKLKPTTPGRRNMSVMDFSGVTKAKKSNKRLLKSLAKNAGRNNTGRITVRHRGGGVKRKYRAIDFDRTDKLNIQGTVTAIEYDPNRTANIMLVTYKDGEKRYHMCPRGIKVGDNVIAGEKTKVKGGNRMKLRNIPVGFEIYNVEMFLNRGGQMVRSAGSAATLSSLDSEDAQVTLPSGEVRYVNKDCYATIGRVSNEDHQHIKVGKAGRKRKMGKRPQVRGKAMNPVDHPHGGGEGSQPIGMKAPKTPWGMPALGFKTRRRSYSDRFIAKARPRRKGRKR